MGCMPWMDKGIPGLATAAVLSRTRLCSSLTPPPQARQRGRRIVFLWAPVPPSSSAQIYDKFMVWDLFKNPPVYRCVGGHSRWTWGDCVLALDGSGWNASCGQHSCMGRCFSLDFVVPMGWVFVKTNTFFVTQNSSIWINLDLQFVFFPDFLFATHLHLQGEFYFMQELVNVFQDTGWNKCRAAHLCIDFFLVHWKAGLCEDIESGSLFTRDSTRDWRALWLKATQLQISWDWRNAASVAVVFSKTNVSLTVTYKKKTICKEKASN